MKRCPRCGKYINENATVCLACGYNGKGKGREYCPECGSVLVEGVCRKCDYKKQGLQNICPMCGKAIKNGVCRKCGYKHKESDSTCPYCGEKLSGKYCYNCNYRKGETTKYLIIIVVIVVGVAMLLGLR